MIDFLSQKEMNLYIPYSHLGKESASEVFYYRKKIDGKMKFEKIKSLIETGEKIGEWENWQVDLIREFDKKINHLEKLVEAYERLEKANPCDPDITNEQIEAYRRLRELKIDE